MILIVAALTEEARVALDSARQVRRIGIGMGLLEARRDGRRFCLLKSGVGPQAASRKLERALRHLQPSLLLLIGYAGALEAGLELGDLVAIYRSSLLKKLQPEAIASGDPTLEGSWELRASSRLADIAISAGLSIHRCQGLTSHELVGDPFNKDALHRQFGAGVIDMETAALARVAESEGIQAACVRAITDSADDEFLLPFSFQSRVGRISTHVSSFAKGKFFQNSQEWNHRTRIARKSLGRFLDVCFSAIAADGMGSDLRES